ncbi:MAG: hypothetical protein K8S62_12435 [Candidatus Sabulitectum sp.]|nr:hypothetical protein [Candidatus Sabulitectum sp.]
MKYLLVLMICFSFSMADRLFFLGQSSFSDYSPSETGPNGCHYDGERTAVSLVLQYQFSLTDEPTSDQITLADEVLQKAENLTQSFALLH